ncbi:MAG: hypothetical protein QOF30_503, partial [Acidimicrobiaceae bacterium]|nr:hypothetical protein [Acidimicrobiaceae bacterium]
MGRSDQKCPTVPVGHWSAAVTSARIWPWFEVQGTIVAGCAVPDPDRHLPTGRIAELPGAVSTGAGGEVTRVEAGAPPGVVTGAPPCVV